MTLPNGIVHLAEFKKQSELIKRFGEGNAHLVWVMGMHLDEPDAIQLGIDCLTDQPNDKKLDFINLDVDAKRVVFAQGYYSNKAGGSAPANKASDLNTAAAWLLSGDLSKVPDDLADSIRECRVAIDKNEIDQIELLYVHNLAQSKNVSDELDTARAHLQKGLEKFEIQVNAKEIGLEECERIFVSKESAILVRDEISIPTKISFEESGEKWNAAVISVPASWLHNLFHTHGQPLFSANYRGFLGVTKRRKINTGIRQTAETAPADFWVFNNGITILTLGFEEQKDGTTKIIGCSIINGAQTTGSIGNIDTKRFDLSKVRVLARLVACKDQETVRSIVRFNNTQNEITSWDQYSNTETQKRILEQFQELGHTYSLKRGFGESISGLGIEVVAQPILAFEGSFEEANRGKNGIFDRKSSYNKTFENKSARHILFVYTLAKAIDQLRFELKKKYSEGTLIKAEEKQHRLARNVRFKYFFMAVIAGVLESILKQKIDVIHVSFNEHVSHAKNCTLEELTEKWRPVIDAVIPLFATQVTADPGEVFASEAELQKIIASVEGLVLATNIHTQVKEFSTVVGAIKQLLNGVPPN